MNLPLLTELPYQQDSAEQFEKLADRPWAVFLDSCYPDMTMGRYDILAAEPYITITTSGAYTEFGNGAYRESSEDDPFTLIRNLLSPSVTPVADLPFCGGAIGYFSYDLGRRLERIPAVAEDAEHIPEMAIGIYDWALVVDHKQQKCWLVGQGRCAGTRKQWQDLVSLFTNKHYPTEREPFEVLHSPKSNLDKHDYAIAFDKIKRYIRDGDCYQVNFAQRFCSKIQGDAWKAYKLLRKINPAPYSAYLCTPDVKILSASPERFLNVVNKRVETKPIKGTSARSEIPLQDNALSEVLYASSKDHAENLMIVDLLRNDLSKNCALGSVKVPKLFNIESFATVHHLVSTVTGELKEDKDCLDLLRGCFPGGSITGAPKVRAMEIIEELEPHRRGVYCGSIGYISYHGNMDTNIAIRTIVNSDDTMRFWAGGGIVADSQMEAEYQETFDKASAMLTLLQQMELKHVGR